MNKAEYFWQVQELDGGAISDCASEAEAQHVCDGLFRDLQRGFRIQPMPGNLIAIARGRVCPNCNAGVGEFCTQPTDFGRKEVNWVHISREGLV